MRRFDGGTNLKAKYEIPFAELPIAYKIVKDLTLTPMVKYVWDRAFDRTAEEIPKTLNADLFRPTDDQPVEYLRFNRRSREDVLGIRLDYQFTRRLNIIGGFQYRKFTDRDQNFRNYLRTFPADVSVPVLYRPDLRTRILEIQAINRGNWIGFYNNSFLDGSNVTDVLTGLDFPFNIALDPNGFYDVTPNTNKFTTTWANIKVQ